MPKSHTQWRTKHRASIVENLKGVTCVKMDVSNTDWPDFNEQLLNYFRTHPELEVELDPIFVLFNSGASGAPHWATATAHITANLGAVVDPDNELLFQVPNKEEGRHIGGYVCGRCQVNYHIFNMPGPMTHYDHE